MANIPELKPVPRYTEMPDCVYEPTGRLRIYREEICGLRKDTVEMMYLDGWGNAFWGPIPVVLANASHQP